MLEFEELKQQLLASRPKLLDLKQGLGYENLTDELENLEKQSAEVGFWDDLEKSQAVQQRMKGIQNKIDSYNKLATQYDDIDALIEIATEENDISLLDETKQAMRDFSDSLEKTMLSTLLTGEYDELNAIMTFHAGAGGTEAEDWAMMLYRMYTRWAEGHGYVYKILDYIDGDEAGIKSASILIEGFNAYGYLKSEAGVHRLVRISPFDSSGRRHTSFASIEVMPEIVNDNELEIRPEELRIDTYRAGGAGGQHVNKTDSAVRITHIPSGVVVACQNERSQHQNKEFAMKLLRAKLAEIKEREHLEKIEDIKGVQNQITWGSQIRSYVFMPYTMVKDHRTGYEVGNVNAVMDGDLDGFIFAYLKAKSSGNL